jgi:hypothetical protein
MLVIIKSLTETNLVRNSTDFTKCQRKLLCPQLIPVLDHIYVVYFYIFSVFKEIFLYHPHLQHEVSQVPYFLHSPNKRFYGILILLVHRAFIAASNMVNFNLNKH